MAISLKLESSSHIQYMLVFTLNNTILFGISAQVFW